MRMTTEHPIPPEELQIHINIGDFRAIGQRFVDEFAKAGLRPEHRMLEIGCGCGRMALPLVDFLGADGSYEGFDVMPSVVAWCEENVADLRFRFQVVNLYNGWYRPDGAGDASSFVFPYPDGEFDFVEAVSIYTHCFPSTHRRYLEETRRVLQSGGKFCATYFFWTPPDPGWTRLEDCYATPDGKPEASILYRPEQVRQAYDVAGLDVCSDVWENPLPFPAQNVVTGSRP